MVAVRKSNFPLVVRRSQLVSPATYIRLQATQADNIRNARFIPPRLGQKGWGRVLVEYVTPTLVHGR
jgi:hypothetical protein